MGGGGEGSAREEQGRHHPSPTRVLGQAEMGRKVQGGVETAHRSPRPSCCRFLQETQGLSVAGFPANRSSPVVFKVCFRGERGGRASREDLGSEPGRLSPALLGCLRLHQHWPGWVGVGQHQLRFRENRRKRLPLPKILVTNPLPSVTQISKLIPLSIPTRRAPPVLICLQAHIGPTRKLPLLNTRSFLSLG